MVAMAATAAMATTTTTRIMEATTPLAEVDTIKAGMAVEGGWIHRRYADHKWRYGEAEWRASNWCSAEHCGRSDNEHI